MIEIDEVGRSKKAMLPGRIEAGSVGRAPIRADPVDGTTIVREGVIVILLAAVDDQLQLRVDLMDQARPSELSEQRLLRIELHFGTAVLDLPAERRWIPRHFCRQTVVVRAIE